jgi:hypothetical protein
MAESEQNVGKIFAMPDWQMYLLVPDDVERLIVNLHQLRKRHYEVAARVLLDASLYKFSAVFFYSETCYESRLI